MAIDPTLGSWLVKYQFFWESKPRIRNQNAQNALSAGVFRPEVKKKLVPLLVDGIPTPLKKYESQLK